MERQTAVDADADGKARVNAQIAALTQRSASSVTKSTKQKHLTAKQRKRREEMIQKGSAFSEKIEKKAIDTAKSQENVKTRARDWAQVNTSVLTELMEADEREAKLVRGDAQAI